MSVYRPPFVELGADLFALLEGMVKEAVRVAQASVDPWRRPPVWDQLRRAIDVNHGWLAERFEVRSVEFSVTPWDRTVEVAARCRCRQRWSVTVDENAMEDGHVVDVMMRAFDHLLETRPPCFARTAKDRQGAHAMTDEPDRIGRGAPKRFYDSRCYDLACVFVQDEAFRDELAALIQTTIDDFTEYGPPAMNAEELAAYRRAEAIR